MKMQRILLTSFVLLSLNAMAREATIKGSVSTKGHAASEYPRLAKISANQAMTSAESKQPGRVVSTSLEDEDGILVYAIQVLDKSAMKHEVLVDAGTGKVLASQANDELESDKNEAED